MTLSIRYLTLSRPSRDVHSYEFINCSTSGKKDKNYSVITNYGMYLLSAREGDVSSSCSEKSLKGWEFADSKLLIFFLLIDRV